MALRPLPARGTDWLPWADELLTEVEARKSQGVGYQTWNGTLWSTRPTGFKYVEAFSDGTAGSTSDAAATTPTGAVDGDRWWKAPA